jgi:hypothetical protein
MLRPMSELRRRSQKPKHPEICIGSKTGSGNTVVVGTSGTGDGQCCHRRNWSANGSSSSSLVLVGGLPRVGNWNLCLLARICGFKSRMGRSQLAVPQWLVDSTKRLRFVCENLASVGCRWGPGGGGGKRREERSPCVKIRICAQRRPLPRGPAGVRSPTHPGEDPFNKRGFQTEISIPHRVVKSRTRCPVFFSCRPGEVCVPRGYQFQWSPACRGLHLRLLHR